MKKYTELCYHAAYEDAHTRGNIRQHVLPMLRREAAELATCRTECSVRSDWAEDWADAGMVEDEDAIRHAIDYAEARLAQFERAAA